MSRFYLNISELQRYNEVGICANGVDFKKNTLFFRNYFPFVKQMFFVMVKLFRFVANCTFSEFYEEICLSGFCLNGSCIVEL